MAVRKIKWSYFRLTEYGLSDWIFVAWIGVAHFSSYMSGGPEFYFTEVIQKTLPLGARHHSPWMRSR